MKILEFIPSYFMVMLKLFLNIIVDTVGRSPRFSKSKTMLTKQRTSNNTHEPDVETEDEIESEEDENTNPHENGNNKNSENGKEKEFKNKSFNEQHENGGLTISNKQDIHSLKIFESTEIQVGSRTVYNATSMNQPKSMDSEESGLEIEEEFLITLLKEAEIKLEHKYINYVSRKLSNGNWYNIFLELGFAITTIQKMEATYRAYVARYKLLMEWSGRSEENTLGKFATLLWEKGESQERSIVKELSLLYYGSIA